MRKRRDRIATQTINDRRKSASDEVIRLFHLADDRISDGVNVLAHRVCTNFQAQAEGKSSEGVIEKLLDVVQQPEIGKYDKKGK